MLSRHGKSPALMETLVPKLNELLSVQAFSDKKWQLTRLVHMIWMVWIKRKECTLVLIDTFSTRAFWYCYSIANLCRWLNIPYAPILHGGLFEQRLQRTPRVCKTVFLNSAVNISPSLFMKEIFQNYDYEVLYLPNFLEIENYPFTIRNIFRPRILWVRAFHEIYNPLMGLKVLELLKVKFPEAILTMVGTDKDGSMLHAKKKAMEFGVLESVNFTGYLSKKDWLNISSDHDFFINTSTADNMPVSVIEGMALGMVVISTNVGGMPFLLQDGVDAYLVNSNDAKSMNEKIISVIENPKLGKQLAESARQKSEGFSWDIVKKKWKETIYKFEKKR